MDALNKLMGLDFPNTPPPAQLETPTGSGVDGDGVDRALQQAPQAVQLEQPQQSTPTVGDGGAAERRAVAAEQRAADLEQRLALMQATMEAEAARCAVAPAAPPPPEVDPPPPPPPPPPNTSPAPRRLDRSDSGSNRSRSRQHRRRPAGPRQPPPPPPGHCPAHPTERLSLYCDECCAAVCGNCAISGRCLGHSLLSALPAAAAAKRENLVRELARLRRSVRTAARGGSCCGSSCSCSLGACQRLTRSHGPPQRSRQPELSGGVAALTAAAERGRAVHEATRAAVGTSPCGRHPGAGLRPVFARC